MKKVYLMKGIAVMALGLTIASCSKDVFDPNALQAQNEEAFNNNFQKSVLNNQEIDPDQTWSTAEQAKVSVSVNLDYGEEYTVYITAGNVDLSNSAYLGVATIKSGNIAEISFAKPSDVVYLQAICYDKDSHATVKPFYMEGTTASVSFGDVTTKSNRAVSTGNRWSIDVQSMPDLSAYTTGTTAINDENNTTNPANTVTKYEIPAGTTWSKNIPLLQSGSGISLYVKGTLNVTGGQGTEWDGNIGKMVSRQMVNGGCTIVVAPGGVVNINDGCALITNANNNEGTTGMIFVEAGGTIQGAGNLLFANGTQVSSYNAGTIKVANINVNGGTLYNAGTLGDPNGTKPAIVGPSTGSKLINYGKAYLSSMTGAGMAVENACNLIVTGVMDINNPSKMDNSSYTECGTLNGGNGASQPLYMGENAYLKVTTKVGTLNNFSIWGPTTSNNTWAFLDVPNAADYINWNDGDPKTCALDHLFIIVPQNYTTIDVNGNWKYNPRMDARTALIYAWLNGAKYLGSGYESRQNCSWGYSAPYSVTKDESDNCGISFVKTSTPTPSANYVYYAFEDLGTTDDFDFNDVVLRVSARNAEGKCSVDLMAAGGTMSTIVTYNGRQIGTEVHSAFETDSEKIMVNTDASDGVSKDFVNLSTIQVDADADLTNLPLGITCQSGSSVINVTRTAVSQTPDRAPLVIVVSGNSAGKWFWPKERVNISTAYTQFGAWGADVSTNTSWYLNYANGKVHTW